MHDVHVTNLTLGMTLTRSIAGHWHVYGEVVGLTMQEVSVKVKDQEEGGDPVETIKVTANGYLPDYDGLYAVARTDMRYSAMINHRDSIRY